MEETLPLSVSHVNKPLVYTNRLHMLLHSIALCFLVYYRLCFFFQDPQSRETPILPWVLVSASEFLLSFIWILGQALYWNPISRTVFPERLPEDEKFPHIDVLICTADPKKEPTLDVMNTVLSAMALDYPPEKLHVYLSDDGGSTVTLNAMREVRKFARWWLSFCTRYRVKCSCPKAYFSASDKDYDDGDFAGNVEFIADKEMVKEKYEAFREAIRKIREDKVLSGDATGTTGQIHPSVVEVIQENTSGEIEEMKLPSLVYVSREKKPSRPHHFKAGALNVLVILQGMDGLKGPLLCGTGFYLKRISLYGNYKIKDPDLELRQYFGSSNEFIKSLKQNPTTNLATGTGHALPREEALLLASCDYEIGTKWGEELGFLYATVAEDVHTAFMLHCNGWNSVVCDPPRPQFLGNATTNLNDLLTQGTRWSTGLFGNGLNWCSPLIYGALRMSLLQSSCYTQFAYFPLYCLSLWCFAIVPQLCLLDGIPLYPKVSNPFFFVFVFIFLSAFAKRLSEVIFTGGTFGKWVIEERMWMMRSITCHLYGCLDAVLKKLGLREASFLPTNKVDDEEQTMLYQMDKYDFRTSDMFLVPMLALLTINMSCFVGGIYRVVSEGEWDKMFIQLFLPVYIIAVNYPIIEGLVIRKDKGRISPSVVLKLNILATIITSAVWPLLRKL